MFYALKKGRPLSGVTFLKAVGQIVGVLLFDAREQIFVVVDPELGVQSSLHQNLVRLLLIPTDSDQLIDNINFWIEGSFPSLE